MIGSLRQGKVLGLKQHECLRKCLVLGLLRDSVKS